MQRRNDKFMGLFCLVGEESDDTLSKCTHTQRFQSVAEKSEDKVIGMNKKER
jgi:hypothetical protein